METCSFSLEASIHLSAYLQLRLRSDVRFKRVDHSVSRHRRRRSRALITRHNHAVWMTIFPVRPWKITAGQYVNVWNPLVDLFSSLHSHPFPIAASRDGEPEVLIQPRSGFIRRLLDRADDYQEDDKSGVELHDEVVERPFGFARNYLSKPESSDFRTAFVSGFHNSNTSAGEDGRVIMIASGNP